MYAHAADTWSPEPVKRATKQDYFRLLKTINTRRYVDPKRKKKQQRSYDRNATVGTVVGGILKRPSMLDLHYHNSGTVSPSNLANMSPIKKLDSMESPNSKL